MSISSTLRDCLRDKGCQYDVVHHTPTFSTSETAEVAHIPGDRLAKSVLLADDRGYAVAVLPSTFQLRMTELWEQTGRHFTLARETDLRDVFKDCEMGALPPIGMAYGMKTYLDESLMLQPEIYFEAGDHEDLIHMRTDQFRDLMEQAETVHFAHRMQ